MLKEATMKRFLYITLMLFGGMLFGCNVEYSEAEKEAIEETTEDVVENAPDIELWNEDSETSDPQSPEKEPDGVDN
jgi:hypothetical protein